MAINWKQALKKMGVGAFIFFLLKGLIWIAVIYFGGSAVFDWLK